MNKFIFTMITGDRTKICILHTMKGRSVPPENYVVKSITSLIDNGGFDAIEDFRLYDAGSPNLNYLQPILDKYPFIKTYTSDILLKIGPNTHRAWHDAFQTSDAEWIISTQDDIVCAKNTYKRMEQWVDKCPANAGLLTLWYPYPTRGEYVPYVPKLFWGNLFLIFKRSFFEWYFNSEHYPILKKRSKAVDMSVKMLFDVGDHGLKIYGHQPSLIEHIGTTSTWISTPAVRKSGNFKGTGYDAFNR